MTYKFQSWSWYYWNIIIIPLEPDSDSLEPAQLRRVKFKQFGAHDKKMFVSRQIAFSAAATLALVPAARLLSKTAKTANWKTAAEMIGHPRSALETR